MGVRVREHHGAWYVFVNHRRHRKSVRAGTKAEADALARKVKLAIAAGTWAAVAPADTTTTPRTLRVWVAEWLEHAPLKSSTLRGYRANLDQHILPVLGDTTLDALDRAACKTLLTTCRKKGLRSKSLTNVARTLSTVLTEAVEQGLLAGNPAFRMGKFCRVETELPHRINPLSREEAALLLGTARDHFPRYYPLVLTALRTGMRLGELLALQWGDLDFAGQFVEVRRSRVQGVTTPPKTLKSQRRIDMSPQLKEALSRLLVARKAECLQRGTKMPAEVFLTEEGSPVDGDNFRSRVWDKLLAKAGVRTIRIHDLRHTFATLLIAQGESLAYVRDQLGHSSIRITVDVYGHLVEGSNRSAVAKLDDPAVGPTVASGVQPAGEAANA